MNDKEIIDANANTVIFDYFIKATAVTGLLR
jgi:hypothetical protein